MTKQYKPRIARLIFIAACALIFFIFDFELLMWICLALVVLPFLIGFTIMLKNYYKKSEELDMKATIEKNGYLRVTAETELESYALRKWADEQVENNTFCDKPKLVVDLGGFNRGENLKN